MWVCYLAERLTRIRIQPIQNEVELHTLISIFDMLRDMAWEYQDTSLATVIQDLFDASHDSLIGVDWKSTIPDQDTITKMLE